MMTLPIPAADAPAFALPATARRRGRPADAESPRKRADHVRCAVLVRSRALLVKQAAAAFGVSPRTVSRWVARAARYDGPEADVLAGLTGRD